LSFFQDVLVKTLSGNGEEGLLSNGEDLAGNRSRGRSAESINVDSENVSHEEEVGRASIGSSNSVRVNVVKGGVDENGAA